MKDSATTTIAHAAERAAALLMQADSLIITAGAGMGIDSGLPDFRGPGGFWGVYPALGERLPGGAFVFTSNVDGQFQQAGFDPQHLHECHGSLHHLQCLRPGMPGRYPPP